MPPTTAATARRGRSRSARVGMIANRSTIPKKLVAYRSGRPHAREPHRVLEREERGEGPLHGPKHDTVLAPDVGDTLQHHDNDAHEDRDQQADVKSPGRRACRPRRSPHAGARASGIGWGAGPRRWSRVHRSA